MILPRYIKALFLGIIALPSLVVGQTACPTTPDFMDLNSSCVVCNTGSTANPFQNTGLVYYRHALITTQDFDPVTGNQLLVIPPGETSSIRLGNWQISAEAEAITYQFKVASDKTLLTLKFAVVLEDPGHGMIAQPRFVVRILDETDELIETCTEYDVSAGAGIPGFETYTGGGTVTRWRPWTTVALDLSSYVGRDIKVQFVTYDCDYGGHFGYAYYTAKCEPNKLNLSACPGDSVVLEAPPFCESYLWSNGDTTRSSVYVMENSNSFAANCVVRSVTGCEFTLNAYISNTSFMNDTVIYDTVCEGSPYTGNYFNLPPQYQIGTHSHINSFFNAGDCSGTADVTLHLTVLQHYYPIEDMICNGESYEKNGFYIHQPVPGTHYDTLRFSRADGCDSLVCLKLRVSQSIHLLPEAILGNPSPCTGEEAAYTIPDAEHFVNFIWTIPKGMSIVRGNNTATIVLRFAEDAASDTLKLYTVNGCGGGTLKLFINMKPSYNLIFEDTMCTGATYAENGFNLPRQDSAGLKMFTQYYVSQHGCDSIRTLHLYIFPSPDIELRSSADVLCVGDSVGLYVVLKEDEIFDFSKSAKIGDILCTDGSVESKLNFPVSGKSPLGVVFWVDPSGMRGWAAALHDTITQWSTEEFQVPDVASIDVNSGVTMFDTTGWQNTYLLLQQDASKYPIAQVVDFENDWFVPAITQLRIFYGNIPYINESFTVAGSKPIPTHLTDMSTVWIYWASTQSDGGRWGWTIDSSGAVSAILKMRTNLVRPIRYFQLTP